MKSRRLLFYFASVLGVLVCSTVSIFAGHQTGPNLYQYVESKPTGNVDPMGEDLIAVGTRNVDIPIAGSYNNFNHMSLEYWEGCKPQFEFKPNNIWRKWNLKRELTGSSLNVEKEGIELQRKVEYGRWEWRRGLNGIDNWEWTVIPTSRIEDRSTARKVHVIRVGGPQELKTEWENYKTTGHNYPYALYNEVDIPPNKWPNIKYFMPWQEPGNNSNTFIRWLVGGGFDFPGGDHAGAMSPTPPSDPGPIPTRIRPPMPPKP